MGERYRNMPSVMNIYKTKDIDGEMELCSHKL